MATNKNRSSEHLKITISKTKVKIFKIYQLKNIFEILRHIYVIRINNFKKSVEQKIQVTIKPKFMSTTNSSKKGLIDCKR